MRVGLTCRFSVLKNLVGGMCVSEYVLKLCMLLCHDAAILDKSKKWWVLWGFCFFFLDKIASSERGEYLLQITIIVFF